MATGGNYRSSVDRVLEESRGRVIDDFSRELETDLELDENGYEGIEEYAAEVISQYGDVDDPLSVVALSKDLKENVTDLVAYKELFEQKLNFTDSFFENLVSEEDYGFADHYMEQNPHIDNTGLDRDDLAAVNALREGSLYDELVSMGEQDTWDTANIGSSPVFEGVNDVADAVIADYYFRGGKGLRSSLGMVVQHGFEEKVDYETMMMGAMAETFHSSTLVQDDLMDGDTERRGRASANILMNDIFGENGEDIPIATGNVMESWTNDLNVHEKLDIPQKSKEAFAKVQDVVNRGQNEDILMGRDLGELSLDDYKHMSMGKTGFLYGGILKMAAENAMSNLGYDEDQRQQVNDLFGEYTSNFNYAFQSSDDLLEVLGGDMDKSDSDIANRKRTATALTTDRILELQADDMGGVPAEEQFRTFFHTDPENDPKDRIEDLHGVELSERIYDNQIRRMMQEHEDVHREQLEAWAEDASNAASELQDHGLSDGAANILQKSAEAMNQRTH